MKKFIKKVIIKIANYIFKKSDFNSRFQKVEKLLIKIQEISPKLADLERNISSIDHQLKLLERATEKKTVSLYQDFRNEDLIILNKIIAKTNLNEPYYVLLSNTVKDVGEYLEFSRTIQLLKEDRPDRSIVVLPGNRPFFDLELINSSEAILIPGGYELSTQLYPEIYPLVDNLKKITVPIVLLGASARSLAVEIEGQSEKESLGGLLDKVRISDMSQGALSSETVSLMKDLKCGKFKVCGSPLFFANDNQREKQEVLQEKSSIQKIAFSLPLDSRFVNETVFLINFLRGEIENVHITCLLHRGGNPIDSQSRMGDLDIAKRIQNEMKELNIEVLDISYDERLMELYRDFDLHLGYRLEAHLYCLSYFKNSILIVTDDKSIEVQKALELPVIEAGYASRQRLETAFYEIFKQEESSFYKVPQKLKEYKKSMKSFLQELP